MLISAIVSTLLLCLAILMHGMNQASYRRSSAARDQPDYLRSFHASQFRRRTAVCFILAGVAGAIMIGHFIPHSIFYLIFWGCVMLLVFWMVILAMVDIMAIRNLLLIERDRHIARRRALEEQYGKSREDRESPPQDSVDENSAE
ncbi:hypothetical protein [Blastopirellula retiformator]|uniref:Uncharacterized protein n=1 Tax=Blastopirellula retiformator TaxID=2527970 RepID=A0A5C5VMD1_9BACT|nr:hypothetical protein [Blastopirellula retiformator]TWT39233.1 hypothetical protein Enr8_09300 [Blastopirellula retiformator]